MCGHVGIAGKLEMKDEALMKRMLVFDFFRGPDSTGFAALRNNGDIFIAKCAGSPVDLFDAGKFKTALVGATSTVFMGHNRYATKGKISSQNAHPYQDGTIVGAHNGTLDSSSWLELDKMLGEKTEVDSHSLIMAISRFGAEAVIPKMRGAWALVWFDTSDNTINFLRNKERPFWIGYSKKLDKVIWASEHPIIHAATAMVGDNPTDTQKYELHTAEVNGETFRFFQTEPDWHYRFDIDDLKKGSDKRPKPRVKEIKGAAPLPVTTTTYNGGATHYPVYNGGGKGVDPFLRGGASTDTKGGTKPSQSNSSTTTSHGNSSTATGGTGSNVVPFEQNIVTTHNGTVIHPFAEIVTAGQFKELAKHGCGWCQRDVDFEEIGIIVFEQYGTVMCPDCAATENKSNRVYTHNQQAMI